MYKLIEMEEEVSDERKLIEGGSFGIFSIWDLADHQVRMEKQVAELNSTDEEQYPNKFEEIEQLSKDLLSEEAEANKAIKECKLNIIFKDVVDSIRG